MQRPYLAKRQPLELGYLFVERFVANQQEQSTWNKTQLTLIVETLVNFVDTFTEAFMSRGYPGTPVWIFERLLAINRYADKTGTLHNREDAELVQLEKPLLEYRHLMSDYETQPMWLVELEDSISKPHQLALGWYHKFHLARLQQDDSYSKDQIKECHEITESILKIAIQSIKEHQGYKKAKKNGALYYDLNANLEKKEDNNSSSPKRSSFRS